MAIDFSKEIDVVDCIDYEEFVERYMKPQKPVKFRNLLRDSTANSKWSPEYFKKELGHIEVGVFDNDPAYLDRSYKQAPVRMKFADYLDLITSGPTDARLHLFNVFKHKPELRHDFEYPEHLVDNIVKGFPFTFFGGEGSVARMHRDMDNANVFLTEFWGRKKVILFGPEYDDLLYRYPFTTHTGVNIEEPDYEKYPGLNFVKGSHTILEKGETLFMPCKYWHHIRYLSTGIGMSFRSLGTVSNTVDGWIQVGLVSTLDDTMRKTTGNWWFEKKTEMADSRARRMMKKGKSRVTNE